MASPFLNLFLWSYSVGPTTIPACSLNRSILSAGPSYWGLCNSRTRSPSQSTNATSCRQQPRCAYRRSNDSDLPGLSQMSWLVQPMAWPSLWWDSASWRLWCQKMGRLTWSRSSAPTTYNRVSYNCIRGPGTGHSCRSRVSTSSCSSWGRSWQSWTAGPSIHGSCHREAGACLLLPTVSRPPQSVSSGIDWRRRDCLAHSCTGSRR